MLDKLGIFTLIPEIRGKNVSLEESYLDCGRCAALFRGHRFSALPLAQQAAQPRPGDLSPGPQWRPAADLDGRLRPRHLSPDLPGHGLRFEDHDDGDAL